MSRYQTQIAGAMMGGIYFPMTLTFDNDSSDLWQPRFSPYGRNIVTQYDPMRFDSLWPTARFLSGDPSVPMSWLGARMENESRYAPSNIRLGSQKWNVFMGRTFDSDGVTPLGGTEVQAFRTADDLFAGTTISDNNGYYEAPTPYGGTTPHYLVAYNDGGTDKAGTTVNTLLPTLRDGTAAPA